MRTESGVTPTPFVRLAEKSYARKDARRSQRASVDSSQTSIRRSRTGKPARRRKAESGGGSRSKTRSTGEGTGVGGECAESPAFPWRGAICGGQNDLGARPPCHHHAAQHIRCEAGCFTSGVNHELLDGVNRSATPCATEQMLSDPRAPGRR